MIQTIYAKVPREKISYLTRPEFINEEQTFHAALKYMGKSKEDTDAILVIMDKIEKKFEKVVNRLQTPFHYCPEGLGISLERRCRHRLHKVFAPGEGLYSLTTI